MSYNIKMILTLLSFLMLNLQAQTLLDRTQDFVTKKSNNLANRLDSFFADERADDEFGRSRIRLRSAYTLRERDPGKMRNQYRINLKLPHLEDKFRFKYKKEKKVGQKSTSQEPPPLINENWIFNADSGVSAAIPPRLVLRARARKNIATTNWIHRFSEQLTYITDRSGLTEETSFNSDFGINENLLFRFVNRKTWRVLKKEFFTSHGPTLIHQLTEKDALNYSFLLNSVIEQKSWFLNGYTFSVNYRRDLYKDWLFLDVIPGIDFPKTWSFRRTPFVVFQLEALFGE